MSKLKDTRSVHYVDIPNSFNLQAEFVYNFFVPDEKDISNDIKGKNVIPTNIKNSTKEKFQMGQVNLDEIEIKNLNYKIPRYVKLSFLIPEIQNDKNNREFYITSRIKNKLFSSTNIQEIIDCVNFENNISAERDRVYVVEDAGIEDRIVSKNSFLKKIKNNEKLKTNLNSEISEGIRLIENQNTGFKYVNSSSKSNLVIKKNTLSLSSVLDAKYSSVLFDALDSQKLANLLNLKNDLRVRGNADVSIFPTLKIVDEEKSASDKPEDVFSYKILGFIVNRRSENELGEAQEIKKFINTFESKAKFVNFIDDSITYGRTYTYSVSTLVIVSSLHIKENRFTKIFSVFGSTPSDSVQVQAIDERLPTNFNHVFYEYDYANNGLNVRWELPVDRRQSIKCVQVFRRKTIHNPFECIAELDFDDSTIRTERSERVDPRRVFRFEMPQNRYLDLDFQKSSNFIYALAAVDAHGLTTGYSTQSQVSFDKIKNRIFIKKISDAGAPKQYPNFYIDPSMDDNVFAQSISEDAMMLSLSKRIQIYFDPDALTLETSEDVVSPDQFLVKNKKENSKYIFHMLNLDLQKDASIIIGINNFDRKLIANSIKPEPIRNLRSNFSIPNQTSNGYLISEADANYKN